MALATVLAVGTAFIVNGILAVAGQDAAMGWIIAGVAAIVVGYASKNLKI